MNPQITVLHVDDDAAARYIRTRILRKASYRVEEAGCGEDALRLAHEISPDVILLDVNLPDMDGLEVCARLKADARTRLTPVLHISACFRDAESTVAGLSQGADGYLTEPVEPRVLILTIAALSRVRRTTAELEAEITQRRRAEEELRASNERLRLLSETAGCLLSIHEPREYISELFKRLSAQIGLDLYCSYLYSPDDRKLRLDSCNGLCPGAVNQFGILRLGEGVCGTAALERRRIVVENIQESDGPWAAGLRKAGAQVYVCHPLLANGRLVGTLSFGTRTRARFQPEELELLQIISNQVAVAMDRARLEDQLRFQASLLDQVRNAVIVTDNDYRIVYWNKFAQEIHGWSAEEVRGRRVTELVVPPDQASEAERLVAHLREHGVWEGEVWTQRKDGTRFPAFLCVAPVEDKTGRRVGWVGVSNDISSRKLLEAQLLRAQKLESIGLLAGGIAHDFNNLLMTIMGGASSALESLAANHPARTLMGSILRSSERAAELTRQLLAYAGKGKVLVKQVDLSDAVSEAVDLFYSLLPDKVQLKLELTTGLPSVEIDPALFHQVLDTLVRNAAEAIGEGHNGSILVRTSKREIGRGTIQNHLDATDIAPGLYASLEVSDTGCGMDDDVKARMFDPFFTTKFIGRGLGLAAVAGIVRSHGGAISVESEPNGGTVMVVYFPAASPPQEATPWKAAS